MSQKKVAIMQPYLFPYLGYFQLIQAVDKFVFYDDVNFIKSGWVNRNNILNNGKAFLFTVPLKKASSFNLINEVQISQNEYNKWIKKFWKTIEQAYSKAPYFDEVQLLLQKAFMEDQSSISEKAINSIKVILEYLRIEKEFYLSSKDFEESKGMDKAERLLYITKKLNAENYVNPSGGTDLYQKEYFQQRGVNLHFIKNHLNSYMQFNHEFIGGLSMIDVLMFNSINDVKKLLNNYKLI